MLPRVVHLFLRGSVGRGENLGKRSLVHAGSIVTPLCDFDHRRLLEVAASLSLPFVSDAHAPYLSRNSYLSVLPVNFTILVTACLRGVLDADIVVVEDAEAFHGQRLAVVLHADHVVFPALEGVLETLLRIWILIKATTR